MSKRSDRTGPGWVAWTGSAVLLASAVVLSFTTLAELASRGGYTDWRRWLFPVVIDAAVAVAVRFWLAPGLARSAQRFGLVLALAMVVLSIGGNALEHHLSGGGLLPAALGAIPPLVLAAVGLLIDLAMRRQVDPPAVASSPATPAGELAASADDDRQADTNADTEPHAPGLQLSDRIDRLQLVRAEDMPATSPASAGPHLARQHLARQLTSSVDAATVERGRQLIAASERTDRRIGRGALAEQLGISTHQARQLLADYDANPPAPAAGDNENQEIASA